MTPGDGRSVLLVHGVSSSRRTWWRAAEDLSELGWRVLTVDLPGHGGRPVPPEAELADLAADAAAQAGSPAVDLVVGHSLGAVVALLLAASRPEFTRAVVIEDPPGLAGGVDPAMVADNVAASAARARATPEAEAAAVLAANPYWTAVDAQSAVDSRRELDVDGLGALLRRSHWDLPRLVEDCPVPVQLIAADGPATALRDPDRADVAAAVGAHRVVSVRSGHSVHRDRPALWLTAVLDFADSVLAP